jgi:hypothetical protein
MLANTVVDELSLVFLKHQSIIAALICLFPFLLAGLFTSVDLPNETTRMLEGKSTFWWAVAVGKMVEIDVKGFDLLCVVVLQLFQVVSFILIPFLRVLLVGLIAGVGGSFVLLVIRGSAGRWLGLGLGLGLGLSFGGLGGFHDCVRWPSAEEFEDVAGAASVLGD